LVWTGETYIALLDEVGVKKMRLPVYWDLVEKERGQYDFSDVDWQLAEAKKRNVEVILSIGSACRDGRNVISRSGRTKVMPSENKPFSRCSGNQWSDIGVIRKS
jgi:beta-galactosidase GanA